MRGTFIPTSGNSLRDEYVFESPAAAKMMVQLDDDRRVDMWDYRPLSLPYSQDGVPRMFTPDFVVSTKNAFYMLEALPYDEAMNPANQEKWLEVKKWCKQENAHFAVVTERGIMRPFKVATTKDEFLPSVAPAAAEVEAPAEVKKALDQKVERNEPKAVSKTDGAWRAVVKLFAIVLLAIFALRLVSLAVDYSKDQVVNPDTGMVDESFIGDDSIAKTRYEFCTWLDTKAPKLGAICS